MKTFGSILVATLLIAAISAKVFKPNVTRRLQDPATALAGAEILGKLAGKVNASIDANKLVDQLRSTIGNQEQPGAIFINMSKDKKGHNMRMMNDVVSISRIYLENYCAYKTACHIWKTQFPFGSPKIKVCMDSECEGPTIRKYTVSQGNLYMYDGEGFDMIGSIDAWKAGLANRRRLSTRRN